MNKKIKNDLRIDVTDFKDQVRRFCKRLKLSQ